MKIKGIVFSIIISAGYAVAMDAPEAQQTKPPSLKQAVIRAKAKEIYEKTTTLAAFQKELQKTPAELKKWSLAEIGRQYYIKYGIQLDTSVPWGVSIQDYLTSPALKNKMPQVRTGLGGIVLDFEIMRINNLYGLQNIPNIKTVQRLSLGKNHLTTIPTNAFAGLTNLEYIGIDSNQLTTIQPNAFSGLTNLEDLRLQKNQLTIIPPNAFAGLPNLNYLHLQQNPLNAQTKEAIEKALRGVDVQINF